MSERPVIEYFYAAHSAFAYIGSALLSRVAKDGGRRIEHRPYDLRVALEALGPGATGNLSPARRAYFFGREIERWAEFRGAPIMNGIPDTHGHDITLPNCLLIAGAETEGKIDNLAHALLQAHWVEGADLADEATLRALAAKSGYDGEALLAKARSPEIMARYQANTEEAIRRSVFGSPTYFVDGDMFYGQDRLDLVARAMKEPFKKMWPSSA